MMPLRPLLFLTLAVAASAAAPRWTEDRAWRWFHGQPLPVGVNYIPADCVSYTEMWMDYGFHPERIDRELSLAQGIGFNCVRVVLPFVVWQAEPAAFLRRFDTFLEICDRRGLKVIPAFFDDCTFGPITDPWFGRQPAEIVGWYANAWTPSPGHKRSVDPKARPELGRYVKAILEAHRTDPRILCWDLYNEPSNSGMGETSLSLLRDVFAWSREVNPRQPLTSAPWGGEAHVTAYQLDHSDIITFHSYGPPEELRARIDAYKRLGRPVICTEWLNRQTGSTVQGCLPVLMQEGVGSLCWGIVNGKDQTDLNWGHRPGDPIPKVWQSDLFRADFRPYDPAEIRLFQRAIWSIRDPSEN